MLFDRVAAATGLADVTAGLPETYWAIRRLLEQVAKDEPLVLVLDDLQWAEPALLDLVDYLVRSSREAPILLLCLARGELLEAIRMGHATPRRDDAAPVAARRRRDERPDRRAAPWRRSRERGQGTDLGGGRRDPLFVVEMFKMLRDDGLLASGKGNGGRARSVASSTVPPTIHALLGARLDRLSDEERAVIHGAAVMGKVFSWSAVLDLVPDPLRPRVGPYLQSLVRRELIEPDRTAAFGEDAFGFHHLLVQEAAYRQIPKELRAELHQRFATWLERTTGDRIGENEEILAYHLEQAARYRIELGRADDVTEGLIDRASSALAVGRRARARGTSRRPGACSRARPNCLPEDDPRHGTRPRARAGVDGERGARACGPDLA